MKLYDFLPSGNGYKVRLLAALLGKDLDRVEIDIVAGGSRTEEFLARNPNGRIPLLELDDGSHLAESNAILFYLAGGSRFLPDDHLHRSRVLQWMFFEQYSHEPYIATSRYMLQHTPDSAERERRLAERKEPGRQALSVMDRRLSQADFFSGAAPSIADLALYAYTHVADEGGFDLQEFPAIGRWCDRIEALEGYIPITSA